VSHYAQGDGSHQAEKLTELWHVPNILQFRNVRCPLNR
jgi:hypothetical protein